MFQCVTIDVETFPTSIWRITRQVFLHHLLSVMWWFLHQHPVSLPTTKLFEETCQMMVLARGINDALPLQPFYIQISNFFTFTMHSPKRMLRALATGPSKSLMSSRPLFIITGLQELREPGIFWSMQCIDRYPRGEYVTGNNEAQKGKRRCQKFDWSRLFQSFH